MAHPRHIVLCEKHNPLPANHGRAARVLSLSDALRGQGFQVTLLVCDGKSSQLPSGAEITAIPRLPWPLRELVVWLELRTIHRESRVDIFQVQNDVLVLAGLLAWLEGFQVRYDAQVVESDFWSHLQSKSIRDRVSSRVMPLCERILCRISNRISVLSELDATLIKQTNRIDPEKVFVIPLSAGRIEATARTPERTRAPPTILFVGSYAHRPNADAIREIDREIRPRVLRAVPEATFQIVGKGLPVQELRARGLDAHSDVDDVTPFIDAATVCIAPVQVGSGVRVKVIEYLSRGRPVVATTPALEGLTVRPGVDLLVADEMDDFAEKVVTLLRTSDLRERLGRSGYERIVELTGDHVVAEAVSAFYSPTSED